MGLKESPIELFIDLGRACNLSCGHCLNRSGPKHLVETLDDVLITEVCELINTNTAISYVHFSGGEPTLYKESIATIQKKILRPIKYAMTSNGSLGKELQHWLLNVQIDRIHLSVDRWHQKEVTPDTIKSFIEIAKRSGIELEVEAVVTSIIELSDFYWLAGLNVEIQPRFLVASGRSKINSEGQTLSENDQCPTFKNNRGLKKIIWFPKKGFSYCCGPLAFDNQQNSDFIYSKTIDQVDNTPLSKFHENKSIKKHLIDLGFKKKQLSGSCDACQFLHKKRTDLGNLSFFEILKSNQRYFSISKPVNEQTWQDLGEDFKLAYFVYNDSPRNLNSEVFGGKSLEDVKITRRPIRDFGIQGMLDFLKVNFFERWVEFRSDSDYKKAEQGTPSYYAKDLQGFWYLKNGQIVALLVFSKDKNHPAVGKDVIHIGHWGYLPQLLDKDEIASIKSNWIKELKTFSELNGWLPLDGIVDDFNSASLGLARKLGFKVHSFRLDKRGIE